MFGQNNAVLKKTPAMIADQTRMGFEPKSQGQILTKTKTKKNNKPNERLEEPLDTSWRSSISCVVDTNSKFL